MSEQTGDPTALGAAAGSAVPITAPRLAAAIARAIFEDGDSNLSKCGRIQFMLGHWPNERPGGGYCESSLRDRLTAKLIEWGCPPVDPPNAVALTDRPVQPHSEKSQ